MYLLLILLLRIYRPLQSLMLTKHSSNTVYTLPLLHFLMKLVPLWAMLSCLIQTHFQVSGRPLNSKERDLLPVPTSRSPRWTGTGRSSLEGDNLTIGSTMSTCSTSVTWSVGEIIITIIIPVCMHDYICCMVHYTHESMTVYRIAGNFRGVKYSLFSWAG